MKKICKVTMKKIFKVTACVAEVEGYPEYTTAYFQADSKEQLVKDLEMNRGDILFIDELEEVSIQQVLNLLNLYID